MWGFCWNEEPLIFQLFLLCSGMEIGFSLASLPMWDAVLQCLQIATNNKDLFMALLQAWQACIYEIWDEKNRRYQISGSLSRLGESFAQFSLWCEIELRVLVSRTQVDSSFWYNGCNSASFGFRSFFFFFYKIIFISTINQNYFQFWFIVKITSVL